MKNVIELGIQTLGHLGLTINRKGTTFSDSYGGVAREVAI